MEYTKFTSLVEKELEYIYEKLLEHDLDADYLNGVIQINTSFGIFIINQHGPSSQIWLSSPVSQASYFSYDENAESWFNKHKQSLREVLEKDLQVNL